MEKEQDRALVMAQDLVKVKAQVPEREWNPVWGLVLVQVLVLELVQLSETDR